MTVNPIEKAQVRVNQAQAALDDALMTGEGTTKARENLRLAQDELARIQAAAQGQDAAKLVEDHRTQEADAQRLVEEARMDLAFAIQDFGNIAMPDTELPLDVAHGLVRAKANQAERQALVSDHERRLSALRARLAELRDGRHAIVIRRADGRTEPSDAAQVALLDADIEGLTALIARREQEGPGPDRSSVAEWQARWNAEIAREKGKALANIAGQLDIALAVVLGEIRTNKTGPWYRPSAALEAALRSL